MYVIFSLSKIHTFICISLNPVLQKMELVNALMLELQQSYQNFKGPLAVP